MEKIYLVIKKIKAEKDITNAINILRTSYFRYNIEYDIIDNKYDDSKELIISYGGSTQRYNLVEDLRIETINELHKKGFLVIFRILTDEAKVVFDKYYTSLLFKRCDKLNINAELEYIIYSRYKEIEDDLFNRKLFEKFGKIDENGNKILNINIKKLEK